MRSPAYAATTIALAAFAGCASVQPAPLAQLPDPNAVATRGAPTTTGDLADAPVVIRIVNTTVQPYRLSLTVGASTRTLGSVPALETRDFVIARRSILGHEEFRLVAIARGGAERRDSEQFSLSNVRAVDWKLDGTLARSVTLR